MNFMARLQTEFAAAHEQLQAKNEALRALRAHIAGEQFCGPASGGSDKDWTAVRDVDARLLEIIEAGL